MSCTGFERSYSTLRRYATCDCLIVGIAADASHSDASVTRPSSLDSAAQSASSKSLREPTLPHTGAAGVDRRLPRAGDVSDDGGGPQVLRGGGRLPGNRFWELLCHHQSHVEWVGCSLHDLIQPSFSFLVGVALPFSLAGRLARGQSKIKMTAHALWRSLILVFLGVFLRSLNSSQTNFTFEDTLSQIGLGLHVSVRAGSLLETNPVGRAGAHPHRILGGLRPLSASRPGV